MTTNFLGNEQDLQGNALSAQRFRMLTEIAEELREKVVFPINFDVTTRIRNVLQKGRPASEIESLLRLDPLIGAKILRVAKSRALRQNLPAVTDIEGAYALLGGEDIVRAASEISHTQMQRSRFLVDFSDWAELLWERSLSMAATAHVLAQKFTKIAPGQAMFAAFCHDMALYYMLYRAVQYPELRARPASLKHLVINWHGGITVSLLTSLALPDDIVDAVSAESPSLPSMPPKTLADIVRISNILAGPLSESFAAPLHDKLTQQFEAEQAEIQAFRRDLRALFS